MCCECCEFRAWITEAPYPPVLFFNRLHKPVLHLTVGSPQREATHAWVLSQKSRGGQTCEGHSNGPIPVQPEPPQPGPGMVDHTALYCQAWSQAWGLMVSGSFTPLSLGLVYLAAPVAGTVLSGFPSPLVLPRINSRVRSLSGTPCYCNPHIPAFVTQSPAWSACPPSSKTALAQGSGSSKGPPLFQDPVLTFCVWLRSFSSLTRSALKPASLKSINLPVIFPHQAASPRGTLPRVSASHLAMLVT